ncbi:hypothetical protein LZ30DRAFT_687883 [Colletotrichum cereale]|nr:hypothetical protein LZ30DRAFT_687883 [Colletotrichum cereale]
MGRISSRCSRAVLRLGDDAASHDQADLLSPTNCFASWMSPEGDVPTGAGQDQRHPDFGIRRHRVVESDESGLPTSLGVVATVGLAVLFPSSSLPVRRKVSELFLAWHVAIAIFVVAGCYWHIVFAFSHKWGYEVWIFVNVN